jgi:hypothetical protein
MRSQNVYIFGLIMAMGCAPTKTDPVPLDEPPDTDTQDNGVDVVTPIDTDVDTGEPQTNTGRAQLYVDIEDPFDEYPTGDPSAQISGQLSVVRGELSELTLTFTSDIDGDLIPPELAEDGTFVWNTEPLTAGMHTLTLTAFHPNGDPVSDEVQLGVCQWPAFQDFSTDPTGGDWMVFGDAHWEPQGWLEITGNVQSRAGSIYKVSNKVNQGDFRLEFKIATGAGINTGADGFSINVIDVADVAELTQYVNTAANGGCLGYGIVPGCTSSGMTVSGFHVEIDTWYNGESHIRDPISRNNHIAINLDGDPGMHGLVAETPGLEDNLWRDIAVQAVGQRLTLDMDGVRIIDAALPGFSFDGGYIGVSGSTGWATNFHRFDDLQIWDRCIVPM